MLHPCHLETYIKVFKKSNFLRLTNLMTPVRCTSLSTVDAIRTPSTSRQWSNVKMDMSTKQCPSQRHSPQKVNVNSMKYGWSGRGILKQSFCKISLTVNLVCSGGETRRRLLGLFMMLGLMVGSLIGGKLVDKYGRKWVMLASITVIIPTQVIDKNNN